METINRIEQTCRRLTREGRKVVSLFSGNPAEQGFRFPAGILEPVYRRAFQTQEYRPHPRGLPEARRAIAAYYGDVIPPENLILTAGTSESFFYLFSLLARPGD